MIFREVKRVLKKSGSLYLNIGDTYTSGKGICINPGGGDQSWQSRNDKKTQYPTGTDAPNRMYKGIPPKCMTMVPERVMFAMVQEGYVLRNKLIWRKPNSMPGSQKDRLTSSWEFVYFFVKSSDTCLWRHRETGEWRDTEPTREEKYPEGGMFRNPDTGEISWEKQKGWVKIMPAWAGFDYYFDLDAIRIPHKTMSIERYSGKDGFFNHGPQPQAFNLRVRDVKRGKLGSTALTGELKASDEEIENYGYPEKPDWREEAAKKGQLFDNPVAHQGGGNTGLAKHHGSSLDNTERLHRGRDGEGKTSPDIKEQDVSTSPQSFARKHHSGYAGADGEPLVDFTKGKNPGDFIDGAGATGSKYGEVSNPQSIRVQGGHTGGKVHPNGAKPGDIVDVHRQRPDGRYEKDHFSRPPEPEVDPERAFAAKGKNPGDTWEDTLWEITTKPSTICVCPKCDTVFKRYIKTCPKCHEKGMTGHFAPFPESLVINPILASSRVGDVVLDPFGGSGTTGVAAKRLGRKAILVDVVRPYCVMARYNLQRVAYQPELLTNSADGCKFQTGGDDEDGHNGGVCENTSDASG